jgi:ATP-dependent DNA helicase RecQ
MAAFAESGACRRKLMLHYFGENFDDSNCKGMCDNCRYPKERYNGINEASLALQAVQQVNEKFGLTHLINVLRGSNNQQVSIYEHDKLPAFDKGKDIDIKAWKSIYSQLIINNFLRKDIEEYGVIKLTEKGEKYIDKPHEITLIKFQDFEKLKREAVPVEDFKTYDVILFDKLRELRRKVAKQKKIPPYVIFQDTSLEDMATKYPISMTEFQNITGVGRGKAKKFAAPFIKMITEYVDSNDIERPTEVVVKTAARKSMNKLFIIQHVDRRTPLDDIASNKGLSFAELLNTIDQIVYSGTRLNIDYYLDERIDEDTIDDVYDYFMSSETDSLDKAEDELGPDITRDEIQLVRIKFISEVGN